MRTSLNNIKAIDDYLLGDLNPGDAFLFDARILLQEDLKNDVADQRLTHETIRQYSRRRLKAEIVALQEKLAIAPEHQGYIQRIMNVFKK